MTHDMVMVPAGSLLPGDVLSDNSLVILPGHNDGPTIERYPLLLRPSGKVERGSGITSTFNLPRRRREDET